MMLSGQIVENDNNRVVVEITMDDKRVAFIDVCEWEYADGTKVLRTVAGMPGGQRHALDYVLEEVDGAVAPRS